VYLCLTSKRVSQCLNRIHNKIQTTNRKLLLVFSTKYVGDLDFFVDSGSRSSILHHSEIGHKITFICVHQVAALFTAEVCNSVVRRYFDKYREY